MLGAPTYVVRACDHVSFDLRAGETLSIVGESGCGKSTTGRAVLRLLDVDSGEVLHRGKSLLRMTRHELQEERRNLQMIFQDPYASLDPPADRGLLDCRADDDPQLLLQKGDVRPRSAAP